jgi:hypothetical protein
VWSSGCFIATAAGNFGAGWRWNIVQAECRMKFYECILGRGMVVLFAVLFAAFVLHCVSRAPTAARFFFTRPSNVPNFALRPATLALRQIKQPNADAIHGVKFVCAFDLFCSRVHLTRAPAYNEKFIPQQKAIQIHGEGVWDDVDAANKSAFNGRIL